MAAKITYLPDQSPYALVLHTAIEAAREAGALLLTDFLRPGGPRGQGAHAESDEEAEKVIRARLQAITPEWGYRGEETAPYGGLASEGHHLWLVDPNDGTSAYLKGWRGTATSIGLLRDDVPVLGVVFAFGTPNNDGDLFAWAEGCGPLKRNGVVTERGLWPRQIARDTLFIVSQSADRATAENLTCVAPGRYLNVPSIAYRLALVAAGEGDVGVGLAGSGSWDYAAAHALLLGVGGELVDETGVPVRYTPGGDSSTVHCFGGAPTLLPDVAARQWSKAIRAASLFSPEKYDLCRPTRGETIADNGLLSRGLGCWLGQLTGDALGSMVEFRSGNDLQMNFPDGLRAIGGSPIWDTLPGQPTDDSEMALMLARTLLCDGRFDADHVLASYRWWLNSSPFDSGATVRAGLRGTHRLDSQANGALMRQSPLAIFGHALAEDELGVMAREDARLTHPNPVCLDASAVFVVTLAAVIREGLSGEEAYARALEWCRAHEASVALVAALDAARTEPPDYETHQGWVLVALQNAFYQTLHASSFEEGVVNTVMGGGDTDTNAAIAGALLGAVHGVRAIPDQWRRAVLGCRPQSGVTGVRHPRPRAFWPVDALILAERLLWAGQSPAGP